jgi:hypothetical protein
VDLFGVEALWPSSLTTTRSLPEAFGVVVGLVLLFTINTIRLPSAVS